MKSIALLLLSIVMGGSTLAQWVPMNSGTTSFLGSMSFPTENTGYAVGITGTIVKTTDAGNNWNPQQSGTPEILYDIYFTNSLTGYVCGANGIVHKTDNGGFPVGLGNPLSSQEGLVIAPNPASGKFTIKAACSFSKADLISTKGEVSTIFTGEALAGEEIAAETGQFSPGMYFVRLHGDQGYLYAKLILLKE